MRSAANRPGGRRNGFRVKLEVNSFISRIYRRHPDSHRHPRTCSESPCHGRLALHRHGSRLARPWMLGTSPLLSGLVFCVCQTGVFCKALEP